MAGIKVPTQSDWWDNSNTPSMEYVTYLSLEISFAYFYVSNISKV